MAENESIFTLLWVKSTKKSLGVFTKRCIRGGRKRLRIPHPNRACFPRAQSGGRPLGELGSRRAEEDRCRKKNRKLEGGTRGLGRQQKDRWKKWITISEIAVPLKACTALAAVVVGVSVLIGIVVDLVLGKQSV